MNKQIQQNEWAERSLSDLLAAIAVLSETSSEGSDDPHDTVLALVDKIIFHLNPKDAAECVHEIQRHSDSEALAMSYVFSYIPRNACRMDNDVEKLKTLASEFEEALIGYFPEKEQRLKDHIARYRDHAISVMELNKSSSS